MRVALAMRQRHALALLSHILPKREREPTVSFLGGKK